MDSNYFYRIGLILFIGLCVCVSVTAWSNSSYSRCVDVNVTNPVGSLSNFPVYVNLSYDSDMQSTYTDLNFYNCSCSSSCSPLSFEVDSYTASLVNVWVKVPSFISGVNTISVYYKNNTIVGNLSNGLNVFNGTYSVVQHLNGVNDSDSARNEPNIVSTNGVILNGSGNVGSSLSYNSPSYAGNKSTFPINSNNDLVNLSTATVEVWVKATNTANYMFWVQSQGACSYNFLLSTYNIIIGNNNIKLCFRDQSGTTRYCVDSGMTLSGSWQYVVGTFSHVALENQSKIYVDGVMRGNRTQAYNLRTGLATTTYLANGCDYGLFVGSLDEVRISKTKLSADWINESYQQIVNPLRVYGSEQSLLTYNSLKGSSVSYSWGDPTGLKVKCGSSLNWSWTLFESCNSTFINGTSTYWSWISTS